MKCRRCPATYDPEKTGRTCPQCGTKATGPTPGAPGAGRPRAKKKRNLRDARLVWVRLSRVDADRVSRMLVGTELDNAKLGRACFAAVDKLRGKQRTDVYLRGLLGSVYDDTVRG